MAGNAPFSVWTGAHDLHSRKGMTDQAVESMQGKGGPPPGAMSGRQKALESSLAPRPVEGNTFGTPMQPPMMSPSEMVDHQIAIRNLINEIIPLRKTVPVK
jgi:hypothetical protein